MATLCGRCGKLVDRLVHHPTSSDGYAAAWAAAAAVPTRGSGPWLVGLLACGLWLLGETHWIPFFGPLARLFAGAYVALWAVQIVRAASDGGDSLPELPGPEGWAMFAAAARVGLAVIVCLLPWLAATLWAAPRLLTLALGALGAAWLPMALLHVALRPSAGAYSPARTLGAIARAGRGYLPIAGAAVAAMLLRAELAPWLRRAVPWVGGLAAEVAALYLLVVAAWIVGAIAHGNPDILDPSP